MIKLVTGSTCEEEKRGSGMCITLGIRNSNYGGSGRGGGRGIGGDYHGGGSRWRGGGGRVNRA